MTYPEEKWTLCVCLFIQTCLMNVKKLIYIITLSCHSFVIPDPLTTTEQTEKDTFVIF